MTANSSTTQSMTTKDNLAAKGLSQLYIGIMSGTSVDGIDVALVEIIDGCTRLLHAIEVAFAPKVRQQILALCADQHTSLSALGQLGVTLGRAYGSAVNQLMAERSLKPEQIRAIGCHGQTLFHAPTGSAPFSMQLVNPHELAATTGITTITDFRGMDIALGGQGAPLVPLFHRSLMAESHDDETLVFANIGGMANLSVLAPEFLGFDSGPGNVLLDAWSMHCLGQSFDKDGRLAQQGQVNSQLLSRLLAEPYFAQPAPKSTGRELFSLSWLQQKLDEYRTDHDDELSDADVMATLVALTASTLTEPLQGYPAGRLLLCGGGTRNPALMAALKQALPHWQLQTTTEAGIDSDAMEAMAFAWLAHRCLNRLPATEPSLTGARHSEVAGCITQVGSHPLELGG
ncbi:anhydro-N-acetylmuramic acid kinase [Ferrimonas aestuarii]|nr:anhydro-N-acetylmuramic acid kinase [Ferrimonas aestuarii]